MSTASINNIQSCKETVDCLRPFTDRRFQITYKLALLIVEGGSSRGIYPYDHTNITLEGSLDKLNVPESIDLTQGSGEVYVEDSLRYTWYTNIGFNIVKNPLYVPESNLPTLEITCSHNQRLFIVSGFPQGFYYLNKLWESSTTGEMSTLTHHGVVGFEEVKDTTFRRYLTDNTAPDSDSTVKPFLRRSSTTEYINFYRPVSRRGEAENFRLNIPRVNLPNAFSETSGDQIILSRWYEPKPEQDAIQPTFTITLKDVARIFRGIVAIYDLGYFSTL